MTDKPQPRQINGKTLTVYPMLLGLQPEEFKDKRLEFKDDLYYVVTYIEDPKVGYYIDPKNAVQHKSSLADGIYLIVVMPPMPTIAYVRKSPYSAIQPKTKDLNVKKKGSNYRGHSSIAIGQNILFGGEANFNQGKLKEWNNNTGHYKVGMEQSGNLSIQSHIEKQTQFLKNDQSQPLLPMSLFRPYKAHEI
jgi:hypothetical protein